jgi:hypothetical protein
MREFRLLSLIGFCLDDFHLGYHVGGGFRAAGGPVFCST